MPQDAALPLQRGLDELEERIHVLVVVEAQPEQLLLPAPLVDRHGAHAQPPRRLGRRKQRADLGLCLGAITPTALARLLPALVREAQVVGVIAVVIRRCTRFPYAALNLLGRRPGLRDIEQGADRRRKPDAAPLGNASAE